MSIAAGVRLGPYEIIAPLGSGGMGEVYRARDMRLDRIVAIKVLPAALAADPQLRERFEREARAVSSLQHPHICALFDVGRDGDHEYLVLEYLEGETLAERLNAARPEGRALRTSDALAIAIQICDALDKAHRSGIIHRDLKPANVMLVRGGRGSAPPTAKLLDFGLAKSAAPAVTTSSLSMLPTTPPTMTAQGTILGTLQYMAPEQIEGLEADGRTDLFAFGAVLFEMLTGRTAFEGKTRATLLGAILKDEPPPVSSLQPLAPRALDRIVATCLAKDPDDRYQSARDLLRELKWAATGTADVSPVESSPRPAASRLAWTIAAVASVALAIASIVELRHARETPPTADPIQFTIVAPPETTFGTPPGGGTGLAPQIAISPDGRLITFVANGQAGYQLWLRSLGSLEARALPGTADATFPFWSPDDRYIAFFADGKLKKVSVAGGPPVALCDAPAGRGGAWNRDNVIVFSPSSVDPLHRVSGAGGIPQPISALDATYGESSHRFPSFLPDGRHFIFASIVGTCCPPAKAGRLRIGLLDSTDTVTLMQADSSVAYASGHVLFNRDGTVMAQPFDTASVRLTGEPFPVAERVASEGSRYASFSASSNGVLVHARGVSRPLTRLTWTDHTGRVIATVGEPAPYISIALSPDERRIAASIANGDARDIWILDSTRGTPVRFTFDAGVTNSPLWSPDDTQLVFSANRDGRPVIGIKRVAGTTKEQLLLGPDASGSAFIPTHWSSDGRYLIFGRTQGVRGSNDIWAMPFSGDRRPFPLVQTPAIENNGVLSPNGRWFAYQASESGQLNQIYVQPFPPTGGKFQVSRGGGFQPRWRADGKALYFLAPDGKMMMTAVETTGEFQSAEPASLITATAVAAPLAATGWQYAVAKDGRFLINAPQQQSTTLPLTVVVNWLAAVQR
jgi:eukaryotic-like serine/threonine-protein kinase